MRDRGLRKFGETGHGEAAVPVDVGPARGKPDQTGRDGKECGQEKADGGENRVVARPRLPVMAAAPKPPKVVPQGRGASGVATKAVRAPTTRKRYARRDRACTVNRTS